MAGARQGYAATSAGASVPASARASLQSASCRGDGRATKLLYGEGLPATPFEATGTAQAAAVRAQSTLGHACSSRITGITRPECSRAVSALALTAA